MLLLVQVVQVVLVDTIYPHNSQLEPRSDVVLLVQVNCQVVLVNYQFILNSQQTSFRCWCCWSKWCIKWFWKIKSYPHNTQLVPGSNAGAGELPQWSETDLPVAIAAVLQDMIDSGELKTNLEPHQIVNYYMLKRDLEEIYKKIVLK